jgi:hypothetical protein
MYKNNHIQVFERMAELFEGRGKDKIYARMMVPSKALSDYKKNNPENEIAYPDPGIRAAFWEEYLKETILLEDDSLPLAYMSEFDEGLYAALLGGEMRFLNNHDWGWVSSMSVPFVESAEELRNLKIDTNSKWAKVYTDQLEYYAEHSAGKYGISHFILIDGLNLLIELRGATNMYYDCIDAPETIEWFLPIAREINYWVQDKYFETIGLYEGGTISNMGQWIPGKIVSESFDPFHMAGPEFFYKWGAANAEEMLSHYDGGVCHIHSGNGQHLIPLVSEVKGLKMIALIDEEWNSFKSFHRLEEIDKERREIPISISLPCEVFREKLIGHELPGNIFYNITGVSSIEEANRLMEQVRDYRV